MAYEQKDNSGTAFPNQYKAAGDNKPDYTGTAKIEGKELRVAIWRKPGQKGEFLSIAFSEQQSKSAQPDRPKPAAPISTPPMNEADDLPF